jgi:hypothetical protein
LSSVALFDEAYRVSINNPAAAGGSHVGLLLGVIDDDKDGLMGIVLVEDGTVTQLDTPFFAIDFRYDPESDRWIDQSAPGSDQVD